MARTLERAAFDAAAALVAAGTPDPERDARLLTRWAAGLDGAGFAAARGELISVEAAARLDAAVAERAARRPLSHIVGERAFYGRSFRIDGRALDPRPESETLVAAALDWLGADADAHVLDLGVGSGCLILSVLAERPRARGLGVDASEQALSLASENAERLGVGDRVDLRAGDWLTNIEGQFDLVLCNPPYIPEAEIADLAPEVRLFEPRAALTPGDDGLAVYRALAPQMRDVLAPGGAAFFEVGRGQAPDVAGFLAQAGLATTLVADLGGIQRVVHAVQQAPPPP